MVDLIELIPLIFIVVVAGSILLIIQNKEQIYAELKKWWKNRNETNE